jgi:signal transduction histidine kinase
VDFISDLRNGHSVVGKTVTFESKRPPRRTFQRSDTPVRDANGQLIGWLLVLRDITEERELDEAREQLTEMIVHDLRGPLTAILGSLKLLDDARHGIPTSPVVSQALSVSERSVQQMLGLVNSLLDLAKLESGELELTLVPLSVGDLCEQMVEMYVHEANEFGIILACQIDEDLPKIPADDDILRRVVGNLVDNALKFTPTGGRVDLKAEACKGGVQLHIADTGPGVPDEFRERIFERFGQVPGLAGRRRGTGLGLTFAKLAVDAHGGRIWVEDNPAGGSIFSVFLPGD